MSIKKDTILQWEIIGHSKTTNTKQKERKEIKLDEYYLVVGFEVNNNEAFIDKVHDLSKDYGHAFFYIVKNNVVSKIFSFGPDGPGKVGWFNAGNQTSPNKYNKYAFMKDGFKDSRPGTPDYPIREKVKVFKLNITFSQGRKLKKVTEIARQEIISGKQKYTAFINDTCAETSKETLDDAGIDTPSGYSWIKDSRLMKGKIVFGVNPYKWHDDFKKKYTEVSYTPSEVNFIKIGLNDPIFGKKS